MALSASALLPRVKRLTDRVHRAQSKAGSRERRWTILSLAVVSVLAACSSVQIARARSAQSATLDTTALSQPDAAALSVQMAELARREQELESAITRADSAPVDDLRQELRHVRATRAWLEERFVADSAVWEKRTGHADHD
jgi:hypothetical protein